MNLNDRHISRCPLCGEWTWRGNCRVDHDHTEQKAA